MYMVPRPVGASDSVLRAGLCSIFTRAKQKLKTIASDTQNFCLVSFKNVILLNFDSNSNQFDKKKW